MANNSERDAVVTFTRTREYSLEGSFAEVARALGITVKKLAAIIDDGDEWPDVENVNKLVRVADEQSEDLTIDDLSEA